MNTCYRKRLWLCLPRILSVTLLTLAALNECCGGGLIQEESAHVPEFDLGELQRVAPYTAHLLKWQLAGTRLTLVRDWKDPLPPTMSRDELLERFTRDAMQAHDVGEEEAQLLAETRLESHERIRERDARLSDMGRRRRMEARGEKGAMWLPGLAAVTDALIQFGGESWGRSGGSRGGSRYESSMSRPGLFVFAEVTDTHMQFLLEESASPYRRLHVSADSQDRWTIRITEDRYLIELKQYRDGRVRLLRCGPPAAKAVFAEDFLTLLELYPDLSRDWLLPLLAHAGFAEAGGGVSEQVRRLLLSRLRIERDGLPEDFKQLMARLNDDRVDERNAASDELDRGYDKWTCEIAWVQEHETLPLDTTHRLRMIVANPAHRTTNRCLTIINEQGCADSVPLLLRLVDVSPPDEKLLLQNRLELVTGQRHGQDAERWREWWRAEHSPPASVMAETQWSNDLPEFDDGPIADARSRINDVMTLFQEDKRIAWNRQWEQFGGWLTPDESRESYRQRFRNMGIDGRSIDRAVEELADENLPLPWDAALRKACQFLSGGNGGSMSSGGSTLQHLRIRRQTDSLVTRATTAGPRLRMGMQERRPAGCSLLVVDDDAGALAITLAGEDFLVDIRQQSDGRIRVVRADDNTMQQMAADNFGKLLEEHPEPAQNWLLPLLDRYGLLVDSEDR
ncbi:MAG: hypothetical protein ACR2NP_09805 [Pirellulaceae bacterium]